MTDHNAANNPIEATAPNDGPPVGRSFAYNPTPMVGMLYIAPHSNALGVALYRRPSRWYCFWMHALLGWRYEHNEVKNG